MKPSRRYYLNRRIKKFAKPIDRRIIEIDHARINSLTEKQKFYLSELRKTGYSIQLIIS